MNMLRSRLPLLCVLAGSSLVMLDVRTASAIPAFSRIHQTSCQTCHVGFPKLNPFGEAFRLNGYRMPAEMQPEEKPLSLGAEAFKKVWPRAIYPSDIPGHVPLAMNVKMASIYASTLDQNGRSVTKNDFQFPQEANLLTGGTLGEHMSFFGEVTWQERPDGGSDTDLEHAQLHINSPFGTPHLVNFKIGKFTPDLAAGFQEMWLSTDNGIDTLFSFNPVGLHGGSGLSDEMAGISLPGMVKGIELYGVAKHRFFYTVGIVNGLGPSPGGNTDANSHKDAYARIDYKFGGMGLDGDTTGIALPPENWRERSVRVGLLGYSGNGKGSDFPFEEQMVTIQDRNFTRAGVYASWYFNDLNVFGVALTGRDRLDTFADGALKDTATHRYQTFFIQSDYVILPPLQASLRYESLSPADSAASRIRFLNTSLSYFAYANVKTTIEYRRDLEESRNYQLSTVLRFAF